MTATASTLRTDLASRISAGRRGRRRRWFAVCGVLAVVVLALALLGLVYGRTVYPLSDVFAVLTGQEVPGASFTVGRLRLPRVLTGLLVGFGFGTAGVIFQTMLRNVLASPDILGISTGASAAAVVAITFFGLRGGAVSLIALLGALGVALAIYGLSWRGGVAGARLVLVGIGIGAMMQSIVAYSLTQAQITEAAEALRWLTGSLNGAFADGLPVLAAAMAVLVPAAYLLDRRLTILQLGDDTANALGVDADRTRLWLLLVAVTLVAVGTAAAGPIAFVAFLSGPIAARLMRGSGSLLLPAGLVGAVVVLASDFAGQYLFDLRFPVGVVTGAVGAPYLLWLLARSNRTGGTL
ncbi:iron complex transport system permease protein [Mumia flava]|uniref:Iron complex transport system permease protein n=1 Tax=Mumia flava TaxID=1348852 RepID=A0A0B2BBK5_9ACTN|nr:iron chelate uptake ABC transporter family permease subunit [Mumia flava]PJJ53840.1 iron complex transport system permease protein [Mumia flava]